MEIWIEKARTPWMRAVAKSISGPDWRDHLAFAVSPGGEDWLKPFQGELGWEVVVRMIAYHEALDGIDYYLHELAVASTPYDTVFYEGRCTATEPNRDALRKSLIAIVERASALPSPTKTPSKLDILRGPWMRGHFNGVLVDQESYDPNFKPDWLKRLQRGLGQPLVKMFEGEDGLEVLKTLQIAYHKMDCAGEHARYGKESEKRVVINSCAEKMVKSHAAAKKTLQSII